MKGGIIMFKWIIEDLKLLDEYNKKARQRNIIFSCENTTSREDKIAFVDKMQNGKLSYILDLKEKFNKEKRNLPTDKWGTVKTVSLKAWIKKNDNLCLADTTYHYGEIFICDTTTNVQNDGKSGFWIYDNLVDEVFHRQLCECVRQEAAYFKAHDEYEILKTTLREKIEKLNTTFGVQLITSSDGSISIGDFNDSRTITADEIKDLLGKYEKLEIYIQELTESTHIIK